MYLLNNNCYFYEDYAICGTRGWFFEEEKSGTHDEKVFRRELMRLEASLKAAGDGKSWCFSTIRPGTRDTPVRRFWIFWRNMVSGSAFMGICTAAATSWRWKGSGMAFSIACCLRTM